MLFVWLLGGLVVMSGLNLTRLNMKMDDIDSKLSVKEYITVITPAEVDIYEYASSLYNVSKELVVAIERHETGNYTSDLFINKNNTFGCKQLNGTWCNFDSTDQSTIELARTLAFKYKVKGEFFNLEHIVEDYCSTNCDTWVSSIEALLKEEKK